LVQIDAKHAQLMSAFAAATQAGDLNALTQMLASDVRIVMDGGGKVRAALNVIEGGDRVAQFLVDATRTPRGMVAGRLQATLCDHQRSARNHLRGTRGPVQTAAFEIEGNVLRALYVVSNPDNYATWRCD
jgi:RNA polymerase sigma-70 factor, ECF subfamily